MRSLGAPTPKRWILFSNSSWMSDLLFADKLRFFQLALTKIKKIEKSLKSGDRKGTPTRLPVKGVHKACYLCVCSTTPSFQSTTALHYTTLR